MRLVRWTALVETPARVWPVELPFERPVVVGQGRASGIELKVDGVPERAVSLTAGADGVALEIARGAEVSLNDVPVTGTALARSGDELAVAGRARLLLQGSLAPAPASRPRRAPYEELFRRVAGELERAGEEVVVLAAVPPPLGASARSAWLDRVTDEVDASPGTVTWAELAQDAVWGLAQGAAPAELHRVLGKAAGTRGQVAVVAGTGGVDDVHRLLGRLWTGLYGPALDAVEPVTEDPVMVRLGALAERLAGLDAPVAVVGPRGSGRGTLALRLASAAGLPVVERAPDGSGGVLHLVRDVSGDQAVKLARTAAGGRLVVTLLEPPPPGFELVVAVPPLSARPLDVVPLAQAFLAHARELFARPRLRLTPELEERLEAWSWPGNVRELKNVVFRAARASVRDEIGPDVLPPDFGEVSAREDLRDAIKSKERQLLLDALARTRWNVTLASARLGMPRRTVVYRMRKLGLKRPAREAHRR